MQVRDQPSTKIRLYRKPDFLRLCFVPSINFAAAKFIDG
jgi:hypothetical protein